VRKPALSGLQIPIRVELGLPDLQVWVIGRPIGYAQEKRPAE
jgi:hypothetical protein